MHGFVYATIVKNSGNERIIPIVGKKDVLKNI